jgi:23S rRNA pseudouridine2457 synthase
VALLLFNKPYGVICQFSRDGEKPTLADFVRVPDVYPAGRLDTDSEGLLLLTDDGALQHRISDPKAKLPKYYWVQVEGIPDQAALDALAAGVDLGDFVTRPGEARAIPEPANLWPRDPPVRYRAAIPTSWIELVITEGKNRQVRRMTAKVGHPTLRLIRHRIGPHALEDLAPGKLRTIDAKPAPARPRPEPGSEMRARHRGPGTPARGKPPGRGAARGSGSRSGAPPGGQRQKTPGATTTGRGSSASVVGAGKPASRRTPGKTAGTAPAKRAAPTRGKPAPAKRSPLRRPK